MDSRDIRIETFENARVAAVNETAESQRETHLVPTMVRFLIQGLLTDGLEEMQHKDSRETAEKKFADILNNLVQERGVEFLTEKVNRGGLRNAFLAQIAQSRTIYGLEVKDIFPEGIPKFKKKEEE